MDRSDIELCIATGGMVNMPAIWNGLVERFGIRVPALHNRESIIAEGAAWIAHDNLRPTLSKPIEVLVADGFGRGTYLPLVNTGLALPLENQTIAAVNRRFFCIDPRDGMATFEFAKPRKVGLLQSTDERATLASLNLPIDPGARAFLERLECQVQIDHDYIARVSLRSKLRDEMVDAEIYDLDFGLALPTSDPSSGRPSADGEPGHGRDNQQRDALRAGKQASVSGSKVTLRSNISDAEEWTLVPGDVVKIWQPNFLVKDSREPTDFQREEEMYYVPCAFCRRTIYQIRNQGPVDDCRRNRCGEEKKQTWRTARRQ